VVSTATALVDLAPSALFHLGLLSAGLDGAPLQQIQDQPTDHNEVNDAALPA
jgi:hypothetical protein